MTVESLPNPPGAVRDTGTASLVVVCAAHWVSHFHILVLPVMFPIFREQLGVGYVDLGIGITIFNIVSGLTQAPLGSMVDRFGAKRILVAGLCLGGAALMMLSVYLSYPWLLVCAALMGLANSVYHPADYAILHASINERRMGRAFSIHTFSGFVGGAVAPATILLLIKFVGWQSALFVAGAIAIAVALLLVAIPTKEQTKHPPGESAAPQNASFTSVMTPAILVLTLFFTLISLSHSGVGNFAVAALMSGYGTTFDGANIALTAWLGFSAVGVLAGGWLADRTNRHAQHAAICYGINAVLILAVAVLPMSQAMIVFLLGLAGFLGGTIAPSRDMLVRKAAPPGAMGRAFGIVSTGFNLGGIVGPPMYGLIMDVGMPHGVFGVTAVFMLLTVALLIFTEWRPPSKVKKTG